MNAASDSFGARVGRLHAYLAECRELAIAYSGGVDSGVLLHAAHAVLGVRAHAVIADSPSLARSELAAALAFARSFGVEPVVLATAELDDPRYQANAGDRCYFCKTALFEALSSWAVARDIGALAFGEITDDALVHRPGRAAARERGVLAPLAECGLGKADVRRYAREHGLAIAEKPASPCLASRLPVGTRVTRERLARVEAGEEALRALGLRELRVRDHGSRARVELAEGELELGWSLRASIEQRLGALGFGEVELARYAAPGELTS